VSRDRAPRPRPAEAADRRGEGAGGGCQLFTDEGRCPFEASWRGVLRVAHDRFEVDTCDRHRAGILDAFPIDGNWEWRRAPEVEFARQHPDPDPSGA
jgi:hypothetical protein